MRQKVPDKIREHCRWLLEIECEDTRLVLLHAATNIDETLESAICAYLPHATKTQKDLFGSERCLGTLSAKIAFARASGLIDEEMQSALTVIRRMRNDAAHSTHPLDLSASPSSERIREMVALASSSEIWKSAEEIMPELARELESDYCNRFFFSIGVITIILRAITLKTSANLPKHCATFHVLDIAVSEDS